MCIVIVYIKNSPHSLNGVHDNYTLRPGCVTITNNDMKILKKKLKLKYLDLFNFSSVFFCYPPSENGWVGVIRSCYYPGDLEDMNETLGCHHHVIADTNFSAIYCLCDRDLCNDATSPSSYPGLRFAGLNSLRSLLTIVLDLRQILASSLLCPIFLTAIFLIDSKLES